MCHGNGCRQETTRLHAISCTKTGLSSLTHNRVLHQALGRSLRESNVQFVVEDTWPFRERASGQNGSLNPLCMDITTEARALFNNHPRLKNKALLLDITIVNPRASSNLGNAARHAGKYFADAVERKQNKYQGFVPRYLLPPSSRYADLWLGWLICTCPHQGAHHTRTHRAGLGGYVQFNKYTHTHTLNEYTHTHTHTHTHT